MNNSFLFWVLLQFFLLYYGFSLRDWIYIVLVLGIFIFGVLGHTCFGIFGKRNIDNKVCNHEHIIHTSEYDYCSVCGKIIKKM